MGGVGEGGGTLDESAISTQAFDLLSHTQLMASSHPCFDTLVQSTLSLVCVDPPGR